MNSVNISSRNQLMKELGKLNRSIKILSRCKKAFIHEKYEKNLLEEICRIIVEVGKYPFVWVGFAEYNDEKSIRPIAKYGYEEDYLDSISISWAEGNENNAPMGIAIRTGELCNVADIQADGNFTSWQYEAIMRGFGSAISLPLIYEERAFGAVTIYAGEAHAFDAQKINLFEELASDIASGVLKLRAHSDEKQIKKLLKETEARYSGLLENTGTGTIVIENSGVISFANSTFETYSGYTKEEIIDKMKWSDVIDKHDHVRMERYHRWRRNEPGRAPDVYECKMVTKQGKLKNMLMKVGMAKGTKISIASFMDITFAKMAEDRLHQSESQLSAIIENFDGNIYVIDLDYRIEFMNKPLAGHKAGTGKGELCYKFLYNLDKPCSWCNRDALLKGDSIQHDIKCSKNNRWYNAIVSPVFGSDGSVSKIQSIIRDITARKISEEALLAREQLLLKENIRLKSTIKDRYKFGEIIGMSQAMQEVYELILKSARGNASIIIYGESGTGKELVARAIHEASDRAGKNFVPINCGAINENVIESEFFGYKKGAFTGAYRNHDGFLDQADGGTLFLDEIGEIGLNMQVKLLRAIDGGGYTPVGGNEVKKANLRIVAATNKNLQDLVKKNLMREDFFYRIHIVPIFLPPLRERKEDLPLLIDHFLRKFSGDKKVPAITGKILEAFNNYDWPGNIRELQNTLHRFVSLKELNFPTLTAPVTDEARKNGGQEIQPLRATVDACEKEAITRALQLCQWHREEAASKLGIHRKTLFSKMKKYQLIN